MLELLRIRNLALIDDAELEFAPGLNVLTGETGAGKSFILRAVNFILGEKMSADLVRAGADKAAVEALFLLPEQAADPDEAESAFHGECVLRRDLLAETGRSRFYVNDRLGSQDAVKAREMKEKNDADALEKERLVADRGAALSELDRLRLALRQRRPASPVGGAESPAQDQGGTDGAGADGLLAACAGDFEGVSAEAGRLALKVNNLQEAITIACPACVDGAPIDD